MKRGYRPRRLRATPGPRYALTYNGDPSELTQDVAAGAVAALIRARVAIVTDRAWTVTRLR